VSVCQPLDAHCTLRCFSRRKLTIGRLYWLQDAKLFGPAHSACGERQEACERASVRVRRKSSPSVGRRVRRMLLKLVVMRACDCAEGPPPPLVPAGATLAARNASGAVATKLGTQEPHNHNKEPSEHDEPADKHLRVKQYTISYAPATMLGTITAVVATLLHHVAIQPPCPRAATRLGDPEFSRRACSASPRQEQKQVAASPNSTPSRPESSPCQMRPAPYRARVFYLQVPEI
jgi:hypothetical protein